MFFNKNWKKTLSLATYFALFFLSTLLFGENSGQIQITNISAREVSEGHYVLEGLVSNKTTNPKELVLRAQITFYDRTAPRGDLPLAVLRKDITIILKSGEERSLQIPLINEGKRWHGAVRLEPFLRIRRQRAWNY